MVITVSVKPHSQTPMAWKDKICYRGRGATAKRKVINRESCYKTFAAHTSEVQVRPGKRRLEKTTSFQAG